ncbi:MAG: hypothetical protein RR855_21595 [Comamonas sp.]
MSISNQIQELPVRIQHEFQAVIALKYLLHAHKPLIFFNSTKAPTKTARSAYCGPGPTGVEGRLHRMAPQQGGSGGSAVAEVRLAL